MSPMPMPPPPPRRVPKGPVPDGTPIPPMVEYDYRPGIDPAPATDELDMLFDDMKNIGAEQKARQQQNNSAIAHKAAASAEMMDDGPSFA